MKKTLTAVLLALSVAAYAHAADKAPTAQQEKMKSCNAEATTKALKGDERKQFMSGCLKGGATASTEKTLTPQQAKMKSCNADASTKGLTGADRKKFMSGCLKGS